MTTFVKTLKGVALVTAMLAPLAGVAHAQDYDGDPAYRRPLDDGDQSFRRRRPDDGDHGDQGRENSPRRHRGDDAAGIAAGVLGGLAGSAAANNGYGSGCHFERRPVVNEDGDVIGRRRVRVCD